MSLSRLQRTLLWITVATVMIVRPCAAENWPGFRGPTGQGISHEKNLPLTWSLAKNVAWRVEIPGIGWSSPVVWEDRVFVTSATPDGTSCHVICINAGQGKILWDKEVFRQESPRKMAENSHATPTPVTDGSRVYAAFNGGRIVAVDFDGHVAWSWRDSQFVSKHGLAASPILYRDLLIMPLDGNGPADVDNISWQQRLGGRYGASPVLAEGRLYCLAEDGVTTVIAAGREFRELAKNKLEGPCEASPAIARGRLFIRSQRALFCIRSGNAR